MCKVKIWAEGEVAHGKMSFEEANELKKEMLKVFPGIQISVNFSTNCPPTK